MSEPARIVGPADTAPHPTNPEAQAWLDEVYAEAANGSLWNTPPIREQLRDHYKRVDFPPK